MANSRRDIRRDQRIQFNALNDDKNQSILHLLMVLDINLNILHRSFGARN